MNWGNPKFIKFEDFLDAFASAWLLQKAQVDDEAQKHGFMAVKSTNEIPRADRLKAALLSLTLNGSFVLLGNGCLSSNGGSGRYEKIPFRKDGKRVSVQVPGGVIVRGEAALQARLAMSDEKKLFKRHTSALQALYYTKNILPEGDALQLGEAVSESIAGLSRTMRGDADETLGSPPAKPDRRDGDKRRYMPARPTKFEPV